jgi:hypothetical protein
MSARALPLALVLGVVALGCGDEAGAPRGSGGGEEPAGVAVPAPFAATFVDATASSGLRFVHRTGGFGEKRLPETMGAGACLFDYDGDGVLDAFLVGGTGWPDGPEPARGACALFRGNGDGTFADVSAASGADVELYGMGVTAADYDGDGDQDLFVTAVGADALLANDGGRFVDVAATAGVSGAPDPEWTTATLWLDADGDGDLDLFVGGYVEWTPETEIFTSFDGVHKVFTTPDRYPGLVSRLYRNDGGGRFAAAGPVGGASSVGKVLGAIADDLDGDGLPEILAANDTRPNSLFQNLGGGRFEERGLDAGLAYDESGRARAGMGIDVARLSGERTVVAIGNFAGEPLSLYERGDGGRFRPAAARSGLAAPTFDPLAFGVAFLDLDLDGWLDLVVVNGHIEPDIARYEPDQTHAQPALLLRGLPDGRFEDVTADAGADFARPRVGRGLAHGDVDGDGDVDLLVTQNGGPAVLLLNRLQETDPRHWLRVRLVGSGANTDAIGAVVELRAGGRTQVRTVRTGGSYLSQGELVQTFGLGAEADVEDLTVRWPDGAVTRHEVDGADRTLVLRAPR